MQWFLNLKPLTAAFVAPCFLKGRFLDIVKEGNAKYVL